MAFYGEGMIERARDYLNNLPKDEIIHSVEGLSLHMHIARSTIYKWLTEEDKKEFSDIVGEILAKQGKALLNKGLSGDYNPSIAKVILTKHGYREGTDITTNDKDIPSPILNVSANHSNDEGTIIEEENKGVTGWNISK